MAVGKTITGNITTGADGEGTLTFLGAAGGGVTGNIGTNVASLLAVNIGGGEVTLGGNVFATNTNLIAGSVLKLAAGKTTTGNITTGDDGEGTLTFLGAGTVTGNIGADVLALAEINITDPANAGPAVVQLKGDVYTKKLNFVTNNQVEIAGNFGGGAKVGGAAGAAGEVDFDAAGGTLTFNGGRGVGDLKTFNATIAHGANGTLNVQGRLKATHADIGNIKTINIGTATPAAGYLTIDASAGNVALLNDDVAAAGPGVAINFLDAASELRLLNTDAAGKTITFYDNLVGFVGGGGVLSLEGTGGLLTVDSNGAKTLGVAGRTLTRLDVRGQVTIAGRAANGLDLQHVPELNVIKGAVFTDNGATSAAIPIINIGFGDATAATADLQAPGKATYVLDAIHGDFNLAGNNINFSDPNARLILRNSDNTGVLKTINLANTLDPGLVANGNGIVELNSVAGGLLKITKAGVQSLGTNLNKLKEVEFSGAGDITIEPIIYAHTITSNATGTVTTNDLCGNVTLNANGQLTGNVIGNVLFNVGGAKLDGNVNGLVVFYIDGGQLKGGRYWWCGFCCCWSVNW